MLQLVRYEGKHVGRIVLAVKSANGEVIPLICDNESEVAEYQKLCQSDIDDVRGQSAPISRPCTQPPIAVFGLAVPPPGWPWFVVTASPFPIPGLQRGYWSFDIATDQEDANRQIKELMGLAGI